MKSVGTVIGVRDLVDNKKGYTCVATIILAEKDPDCGFVGTDLKVASFWSKSSTSEQIYIDMPVLIDYESFSNGVVRVTGLYPYTAPETL